MLTIEFGFGQSINYFTYIPLDFQTVAYSKIYGHESTENIHIGCHIFQCEKV